jgi:glycosyltransferase involved in cell wall biosynthesis
MTKNLSINLFQANDPLSLAKAINNIWNNDLLIKQQIENNYNNLHIYKWSEVTKEYFNMFEKIIENEKFN